MGTAPSTTQPIEEQRVKMSYDAFVSHVAEGVHAEWVNGEAILFMPPKDLHQAIVGFLYRLIAQYVDLFDLGVVRIAPFEMRIEPEGNAREPDILFLAQENRAHLTAARLAGPADLVVEVISDESVARDRADKFYEYQEGGVREYWIIDPRPGKQRVDVYWLTPEGRYQPVLPDAEDRYHSTVLPGLWFRTTWVTQEHTPDPLRALLEIAPQALRDALQ